MSYTGNILYVYHPDGTIQPLIAPNGGYYATPAVFLSYLEVEALRNTKEEEKKKEEAKKEEAKKKKEEAKKKDEFARAVHFNAAMMARPLVYDDDKALPGMEWWFLGSDGLYALYN